MSYPVGYCGECDEQFEFHYGSVYLVEEKDNKEEVYIHIICPRCDNYDEVKATFQGYRE